jgi:hypothetical protein
MLPVWILDKRFVCNFFAWRTISGSDLSIDESRGKRPLSECDSAWRIVEDELGATADDGNSMHCLLETDEMRPFEDDLEGDDDGLSLMLQKLGEDDGLCAIDEKTESEIFGAAEVRGLGLRVL